MYMCGGKIKGRKLLTRRLWETIHDQIFRDVMTVGIENSHTDHKARKNKQFESLLSKLEPPEISCEMVCSIEPN